MNRVFRGHTPGIEKEHTITRADREGLSAVGLTWTGFDTLDIPRARYRCARLFEVGLLERRVHPDIDLIDGRPNLTTVQAWIRRGACIYQYRTNPAAIAFATGIRPDPPDAERADARTICDSCGERYDRHPLHPASRPDVEGGLLLHTLCDGTPVKL